MKQFIAATLTALIITLSSPLSAFASAERVFTKLDGVYRGSGSSITDSSGKKRRVSCQLTNTYSKSSGKLRMRGKCASSQGSSLVRGSITHKGNNVSGSYISLRGNVVMNSSKGRAGKNSLTINSSFTDKNDGKKYKIRQILKLTKSGFQASFYSFDNRSKKYKSAGSLSFKRK